MFPRTYITFFGFIYAVLTISACMNVPSEQNQVDGDISTDQEPNETTHQECFSEGPGCLESWRILCEDGFIVRLEDCSVHEMVCESGVCTSSDIDGDKDEDRFDFDFEPDNELDFDSDFFTDVDQDSECLCGPEFNECCDGCYPIHEADGCTPIDANALGGHCYQGSCRVDACREGYEQIDWFTCQSVAGDGDEEISGDADSSTEADAEHDVIDGDADPDVDLDIVDFPEDDLDLAEEEYFDIPDTTESDEAELDIEVEELPQECVSGPCCSNGSWVSVDQPCVSGIDNFTCTDDRCTDEHECGHYLLENYCLIDEQCIVSGTPADGVECRVCNPALNETSWSFSQDDTECDDGDKCNGVSICQEGDCIQTTLPVACTALDECHVPGICNPTTGQCTNPTGNEGSPCNDDGDKCNGINTCVTGSCIQTEAPVTCTVLDSCHVIGVCAPDTGVCSNPTGHEGEACNEDGNQCNGINTCVSGNCTQTTAPVTCAALDECHVPGTCNPLTGQCTNPTGNEDSPCNDDGDKCNGISTCQGGACIQTTSPVTCTAQDECHDVGVCDSGTGLCSNPRKADGVSCDNETVCDGHETCQEGICEPGMALDCQISTDCFYGYCDPASGCQVEAIPDGTPCPDSDPCNGEEQCWNGFCQAGLPLVCPSSSGQCKDMECLVGIGCQEGNLTDGLACEDGNENTAGDYCENGDCQSGEPNGLPVSFVPATGLTSCYDETGTVISCGDPTSVYSGQDADVPSAPMHYSFPETVLRGDESPTLNDDLTGLVWQRDGASSKVNLAQANNYCDTLVLGGRDDWRLPNRKELISIVDYSQIANQQPTINPLFTGTFKDNYWTNDVSGDNPDKNFRVSFKYGTSNDQDKAVADAYARCVTGTSSYSQSQLFKIPQEDGAYDPSTGLMWQRAVSGYLPWQAALDYCDSLNQYEFKGWRMPNVKELATLLRPGYAYPVVDPNLFPGVLPSHTFWASTTSNDPVYRSYAYIVSLGGKGTISSQGRKQDSYQVLCVRACPCPDPQCCARCVPLQDGVGCDDGDSNTVYDRCISGHCTGDIQGTPPPSAEPPYDCQTLTCGAGALCVRLDGSEECICNNGFIYDGANCVVDETYSPPEGLECVDYDTGAGAVCLKQFQSPLGMEPTKGQVRTSSLGMEGAGFRSGSKVISPPVGFLIHGQHESQYCVPHAINGGVELALGTLYQSLSEAHLLDSMYSPSSSPSACAGVTDEYVLDFQENPPESYLVPDSTWDIDYSDWWCLFTSIEDKPGDDLLLSNGIARFESGEFIPLTATPSRTDQIKQYLNQNHPVVIRSPVFNDRWKNWGVDGWRIVDSQPWKANRTAICGTSSADGRNVEKCLCNSDNDCSKIESKSTCLKKACISGWHAILIIGYDDADLAGNDPAGRFYFLNSWDAHDSHWGKSAFGYPAGLGKMSYEFVNNYAGWALAVTGVKRKCEDPQFGACVVGTMKCDPAFPNIVWECQTDQDGCSRYKVVESCPSHQKCWQEPPYSPQCRGYCGNRSNGKPVCEPELGENCLTCSQDCGCTEGTCQSDGLCRKSCGADACLTGEVGCVDNDTRWWCGLQPGDDCRDQIPVNCAAHEKCEGGACVTDCNTPRQHHKDCKPGTNEVWWYNWCYQATDFVETCLAEEVCSSGECIPDCSGTGPLVCYQDDEYESNLCGDPTRRHRDCGSSAYVGSPTCSDDGIAFLRQYCDKGCSNGACFSSCRSERTECQNGMLCQSGQCTTTGATCGDHICTPDLENCANCPEDCTCWSDNAPVCAASGQCVQCLQDSHCSQGYTCNTSTHTCQSGCNECGPVGTHQCLSPSSRQTCQLVGNCLKWAADNCGSGYSCCQGDCVSTTSPAAPALVSPASGATVPAGTVRFEWQNSAGMARATFKVCTTQNLQGNCPIVEELPPGYYYREKTLSQGTYWWSVRGITTCDASPWGNFATARQLIVGAPSNPETCNGLDDDNDGRIDNVGANGMGCFSEIWAFSRINDPGNVRLQFGQTPGTPPTNVPTEYQSLYDHPVWMEYYPNYSISGLTKLYYCLRTSPPYDNLYTTNWQAECGSYDVKDETKYIGYIFTYDPGSTTAYGNWLYSAHLNEAVYPAPLWRIRKPATNQHMFFAHEGSMSSYLTSGWCCERGPSSLCSGHWCGSANTNPVGWVLVPR